jgi:glycosyltransferase involved in cell wall biosynthesis
MRILIVSDTYLPYITGVSISTDSIARYMVGQGHQVVLITPKPVIKGVVTPLKGLEIIHVPSLPFAFYNNNAVAILPLCFPVIARAMKKNKFDVVHIQEPAPTGFAALILAKIHHIPVVGALHFIPEQVDRVIWGKTEKILTPIVNIYIRLIYRHYDQIMTPSYFFANHLKRLGIKRPINVISNGVDIDKFHPAPINLKFKKKYGISEKSVLFFYLGRIDGDKNVETLVKAMPLTDNHVRLLIVGRGKKDESIRSLAEKLKVSSKITRIEYITNEEMPGVYLAADVFSIMSPYEGQSIVTLQAAATGLPIIGANAGALPELIHDGENGFLVGTHDYRELAVKMNKLAGNQALRKSFGEESRKISLEHDKPKVLHKLEVIFDTLGNSKFPSHPESIS